jgi:hypothetical protein
LEGLGRIPQLKENARRTKTQTHTLRKKESEVVAGMKSMRNVAHIIKLNAKLDTARCSLIFGVLTNV